MRNRTALLKNLISISICSKDPGQHIFVKQRLVDASSKPSAFSGFCAMGAATRYSSATICFFSFSASFLTVFKSVMPYGNFFY
jgi:hypothetical protein